MRSSCADGPRSRGRSWNLLRIISGALRALQRGNQAVGSTEASGLPVQWRDSGDRLELLLGVRMEVDLDAIERSSRCVVRGLTLIVPRAAVRPLRAWAQRPRSLLAVLARPRIADLERDVRRGR